MPIFETEARRVEGDSPMQLGRLRALNDAESGAYLSRVQGKGGRLLTVVAPTIVDTASLKFTLPALTVTDVLLQQRYDQDSYEAVPINDGTELTLGEAALHGIFVQSSLYMSYFVPVLGTDERKYVHNYRGYLWRPADEIDARMACSWETDDLFL